MESLELKKISFSYNDKKILDDISLSIKSKQIVSLLGVSGSGKTTLLEIAQQSKSQESGKVINSFKNLSFVFQEPRLLSWKNVIENITFSLLEIKEDKKVLEQKAKDIALALGLAKEDFAKYPKHLSGGMAQRVSLARALIKSPDILFLDEPFSALDIGTKKEIFKIMIELCKKENIAIFFITHDFNEAVRLSDKILFLDKKQSGSVIKESIILSTPQNKRESKYVYQKMVELLENEKIKNIFDL
ncbi:MAG: ABC transporter ATP-binding protein [Campylobacterota bacterium]|nr:ABC transporter ATP-binding protein [Campylobacterota bacterium]